MSSHQVQRQEKLDSDDGVDMVSLVTAKLVNTTITPEPEPLPSSPSREKRPNPEERFRASLFER